MHVPVRRDTSRFQKVKNTKRKTRIFVANTVSQCVLPGVPRPACARARGRGAGAVGLRTALLLSGLGRFLSLGPSFLIYKPLNVWCSASGFFFFFSFHFQCTWKAFELRPEVGPGAPQPGTDLISVTC